MQSEAAISGMKIWQFKVLDLYPAFDGWSTEFTETGRNPFFYKVKYSKPGTGSIYLFFSKDIDLKECSGTLDFYFQISPQELNWDVDYILKTSQVKRWH